MGKQTANSTTAAPRRLRFLLEEVLLLVLIMGNSEVVDFRCAPLAYLRAATPAF